MEEPALVKGAPCKPLPPSCQTAGCRPLILSLPFRRALPCQPPRLLQNIGRLSPAPTSSPRCKTTPSPAMSVPAALPSRRRSSRAGRRDRGDPCWRVAARAANQAAQASGGLQVGGRTVMGWQGSEPAGLLAHSDASCAPRGRNGHGTVPAQQKQPPCRTMPCPCHSSHDPHLTTQQAM